MGRRGFRRSLGLEAWDLRLEAKHLRPSTREARKCKLPKPQAASPKPLASIRCPLTRERPAMTARPLIQLGLRHLEQIRTALAQQQSQIERSRVGAADHRRIEEIDAAGLETALARSRKVGDRAFGIGRDDLPLEMMAPQLVA